MNLALNNLQWLMCHKTQPNQTKSNIKCQKLNFFKIKNWVLVMLLLHITYLFNGISTPYGLFNAKN